MAMAPPVSPPQSDRLTLLEGDKKVLTAYPVGLALMAILFFLWGFITVLNDALIPQLKAAFSLSYYEVMLVQTCFFSAYLIVSLPASWVIERVGYQRTVVLGLATMALACALFYPGAASGQFGWFLACLFLLASGITTLQVAANPYAAALGPPQTASARLNLTQAFNSVGTFVAPVFGALFLVDEVQTVARAETVQIPYLALAGVLVVAALAFAFAPLPPIPSAPVIVSQSAGEATRRPLSRGAWLGILGIFSYVGAEVAIGSFLALYLHRPDVWNASLPIATDAVKYYWGAAMIGRFVGVYVLRYLSAGRLLTINAGLIILLLALAAVWGGPVSGYLLIMVGFFNSVMFPNIFALTLNGVPASERTRVSGYLCMAIVGGAVIPAAQGLMADRFGEQLSLILPALAYGYVLFFGSRQGRGIQG